MVLITRVTSQGENNWATWCTWPPWNTKDTPQVEAPLQDIMIWPKGKGSARIFSPWKQNTKMGTSRHNETFATNPCSTTCEPCMVKKCSSNAANTFYLRPLKWNEHLWKKGSATSEQVHAHPIPRRKTIRAKHSKTTNPRFFCEIEETGREHKKYKKNSQTALKQPHSNQPQLRIVAKTINWMKQRWKFSVIGENWGHGKCRFPTTFVDFPCWDLGSPKITEKEVWLQKIGEFMVDDPSIPMTCDVQIHRTLALRSCLHEYSSE